MALDYAVLLDSMPNPLLVTNDADRILYANASAEEFLQTSATGLARCKLSDVIPFASPLHALIAQVRDKSRRPQDAFLALATLIEPDGKPRQLKRDELHFEPLQEWRSPHTGASYPTRWRVTAPSAQLDLEVRTRFDDQEAELSTVYYEGAVSAEGTVLSKTVHGVGYLEMTGYSASIGTQLR